MNDVYFKLQTLIPLLQYFDFLFMFFHSFLQQENQSANLNMFLYTILVMKIIVITKIFLIFKLHICSAASMYNLYDEEDEDERRVTRVCSALFA